MKTGFAIFLLSSAFAVFSAEKLFLLAEDGFNEFLKQDFHILARSMSDRYDCKLSAIAEKGVKPVLKISKVKEDGDYETVLFAVKGNLFLVNEENPVKDLSVEDVKDIFAGKFRMWKRTNVPLRQICYSGPEKLKPEFLEKDSVMWIRFRSSQLALQMLVDDLTALAIIPFTDARVIVQKTKLVSVGGVQATPKNVMNGTYPAATRYFLSIRKDAPAEIRNIYLKLRSKQTKLKLLKAGILPAVEGD